MAAPPLYASSLDDIRDLVRAAAPGEKLLVAISGNVSFEEAHKLWEVVTTDISPCELVNMEVLYNKLHASNFVDERIGELEEWRARVDSQIEVMTGWMSDMESTLESGGPDVPHHYRPVFLRGPRVFIDVSQAGRVNGPKNWETILEQFGYAGECGPRSEITTYWDEGAAVDREKLDRRSFISLNLSVLQIKLNSLGALREQITKGIKSLQGLWDKPMYVGYGNCDFTAYRDLEMLDIPCKRCRDGGQEETAGGKRIKADPTDMPMLVD